ncbi:type II toxin-antitoxin system HipA family toxin [Achromobacter xylosoxidans]
MATSRYVPVDSVSVNLWGKQIGAVALDPYYGYYVFEYTPAFTASGVEPSPLHMPTSGGPLFLFTDLPIPTFKRLPAMLSDALPDDFGNALINRYMAERGISAGNVTALDRLAYMSNRAMGALTFHPQRGPKTTKPSAIEMGALVTQARAAVSGHLNDEDEANLALRNIIEVGTSAGGARAKAVVAWNPKTDELRTGQLDADPGFEHWLLKFDGMGADQELGASQDYGRIEYAYHLMARAAGVDMMDCRLLTENGRAHFMTRRFDRGDGHVRHHMQTLCAMDHLDYKLKGTNAYAQLFSVIQRMGLPYEAMEEAFRRMVFNVMARNCDDHTKNFSFRLQEGQPWELAPAYDVTFAHNPNGEWTHQHLMSVNGKFKGHEYADFQAEADLCGVGSVRSVVDRVRSALADWPKFADQAGLPAKVVAELQAMHLDIK